MPNVVVIGAGVSGLTCAVLLSKIDGYAVTVLAKHMPGDTDVEYTSPYAGANVLPMNDEANSQWEARTWPELARLAAEVPEAGIHFQRSRVLRRKKDFVVDTEESAVASGAVPGHEAGGKSIFFDDSLFSPDPWYASLFPDFRSLRDDELRETAGWGIGDVDGGCVFTSVCINTPVYLAWLVGQCLRQGVVFRRATLAHVLDAAASSAGGTAPVDIIVNCTGLLASKLGGVADAAVIPARGQTVLVRNVAPYMVCVSGVDYDGDNTDDSNAEAKGEVVYVMTRAAGGGTILGGTYQKGNWNGEPDMRTARRIMRRAIAACPGLVREGEGVEGLDVIRHAVGLRPYREGGVRIEKEWIADDRNQENFTGCKGAWVVHNYGHAGWGYQSSYGCAERVVELVKEAVALGPMADGSGV